MDQMEATQHDFLDAPSDDGTRTGTKTSGGQRFGRPKVGAQHVATTFRVGDLWGRRVCLHSEGTTPLDQLELSTEIRYIVRPSCRSQQS